MGIKEALTELYGLLDGWGLTIKDYVLVDEFAYLLQGYDLEGPEIKSKHLDLYVNPNSLPWKPRDERSTFPPINTPYMRNYEYFMKNTGYALDLLVSNPKIMSAKIVNHMLPNKQNFPLMDVEEMTLQFVNHTLLHYSLEDVGKEKVHEWFGKLRKIHDLAKDKNHNTLIKLTADLISKAQNHWEAKLELE